MTKTAIVGGILMALSTIIGIFGDVTVNGEIVENNAGALFIAVVVFPTVILILGYVFGFLKDALIAFFVEIKKKFSKKNTTTGNSPAGDQI